MSDKKNDKFNKVDDTKYSMETHLIYGKNVSQRWDYSHHVTAPISSSTTFRLDSVERGAMGFQQFANLEKDDGTPIFIYDRLGEPNKDMLEENLAHIERGEMAVTFSSGMGAISAVLGVLAGAGDDIITHTTMYGCTISLFNNWYPKYNIGVSPVDLTDPNKIFDVVTDKTKAVYFETPANPNMDIIDIETIANIVKDLNKTRSKEYQIQVVVDNTFSTSFCQRPIELGADFTVHSLTKGMSGFGTEMGGAVIGRKEFRDKILLYRKDFGAVLNTRSAWSILTYGLPSLHIRQKHIINSAMRIARYLEESPKVEFVNYPGLASFKYYELARKQMYDFNNEFAPGGMIYFTLKGDNIDDTRNKGARMMNYVAENAYTLTLAVSLGNTRTLIEHPASMTHSVVPPDKLEERKIDAGGVRIAVGLENVDDILKDLETALEQI